jgi:hypothetical protein
MSRYTDHKELVMFQKKLKNSKRWCQKFGLNYKENPYCIGVKGNYARELYPHLKYVI